MMRMGGGRSSRGPLPEKLPLTVETNAPLKWLVTHDTLFSESSILSNESRPCLDVAVKASRFERRIKRTKRAARSELDLNNWSRGNFARLNFAIPDDLDTVPRIDVDRVSDAEFVDCFEREGRPVVIVGAEREWAAVKEWAPKRLLERFHNEKFKVGEDDDGDAVYVQFSFFMHYCLNGEADKDDSPLYIFDPNFGDRSRSNTADYIKKKKKSKGDKTGDDYAEEKTVDNKVDDDRNVSGGHISNPACANGFASAPEPADTMVPQHVLSDNPDEFVPTKRSKVEISDKPVSPKLQQNTTRIISPPTLTIPPPANPPELSKFKLTLRTPNSPAATPSNPNPPSPPPAPALLESRPTKEMLTDYKPPRYFRDDLFQYTGSRRPPHRWVVIGPKRSGTGIHVDPLGTSAWNTLLTGHKRWALFPPTTPKYLLTLPNMPDHEAASWFVLVYPRLHDSATCDASGRTLAQRLGCVDLLQRPGETVFVPGGWHHVVVNLDFTVGVTQNFASVAGWEGVWLKTRDSRPRMAQRLLARLEEMGRGEGARAAVARELVQVARGLRTVPALPPSSSESSSSSSSESETEGGSRDGTQSESSDGEGRCMCRRCKIRRKRAAGTLGFPTLKNAKVVLTTGAVSERNLEG
ncbi:hypothetical protein BC830DRAFT_1106010 [Chytriomyces sp. MP71]|nr:hypothetical protein BC830DRAFT_1106010 [Chytriomyces sp. MP71]